MSWEDLNIKEKSDLMRLYISNGIMDLDSIKEHYNVFQDGGNIKMPRGYKVSSKLMKIAQRQIDKDAALQDSDYEPDNGMPQATFLMSRKNQQKAFEQYGYTRLNNSGYGPVANAVTNSPHKDIPVYQKYPDVDVDRDNLQKIGTFLDNASAGETDVYKGPQDSYLPDPAYFPVDVYIDRKTGKVYNQGWDFNDYHNTGKAYGTSRLKNIAGNLLDRIGSPTVVTTGLQAHPYYSAEADNYIQDKTNGLLHYEMNPATGDYEIMLPSVTVTAKRTNPVSKSNVELRPASELNEEEFWDMMEANSRQNGGHLYQEGGNTNNKSDWAKAHETGLMLHQLGWDNPDNRLHSDYAAKDSNGYYAGYNLKPVTVRPSVQQLLRDWSKNNPKAKGIVEYIDPDIVAENNIMGLKLWGALAGVKAPIKSVVRRQLLRPTETLMGIGGGYGTDKIIQGFTDYNSWGDMLAGEVFNSDNALLQLGLELTNPAGYLGGLYGHSIDKKLAESIVRFGEPVKHIANNLIYNISTEKSLPKAIFRTVEDFNDRLDGSKGKILNYVLNPFVKSDYKYKIPAFTYSGAQQSDEINALRPFIGDPVDVFFGHSRFGNYRQIEVPRKYIQWAENKGLNSKKIKAYDLQEVSPLTITSEKGGVSSEGLLPVRRSLDKFRINDRGTRMLEDSRGIAVTSQKPVLDPGGFNFDYQIGDTKFYSDIWKYNGLDGFNRYILKEPSAKYIKPLVTYFGDFIDTQGSPFVTTFFTNPSQIGTLIRK